MKRRLLSALLGFLFANATLVGSASGCAFRVHEEQAKHGHHGAPGEHAAHALPATVVPDASSTGDAPADVERHALQCDMARACSMVASVGEGIVLAETLPVLRHVVWDPVTAPRSVTGAPEPPPPRA